MQTTEIDNRINYEIVPSLFFSRSQIVRERSFRNTYAVGQELPLSIAYAGDLKSVVFLNKVPSVSMIITTENFVKKIDSSKGVVVSDNPQKDFFLLHNAMIEKDYIKPLNGGFIHPTAEIAPTSIIKENVIIGKNVRIGDFCVIEPNTIIGDDCEICCYVAIGTSCMQRTLVEDNLFHLKNAGGVRIGRRTRVLTGAIIQRPFQPFYTTVGDDTVISTRVIIGHGSQVGSRTMISGGSGIAGNCRVGDDVWIGSGAVVADNLSVGNKAKILVGSVVIKNLNEGEVVSGNFALDHKQNLRNQIRLKG